MIKEQEFSSAHDNKNINVYESWKQNIHSCDRESVREAKDLNMTFDKCIPQEQRSKEETK